MNLKSILFSRSGPILHLTWAEFEEIEATNQELTTNRHKTGKFYTVHLYIQPDQRKFLRAMKAKYIQEYQMEPTLIFASRVNKVESSICRGLQEVFKDLFGDDPDKVRYNANSIRKFWERLWTLKGTVSEGVNTAHLAQTAHSEKTAKEKYLHKNGTREERMQVLKIYSDRLLNRGNDEDGIVDTFSPPSSDEPVSSDFEDQEDEVAGEQTMQPIEKIESCTRFNLARDSLQPTTVAADYGRHPHPTTLEASTPRTPLESPTPRAPKTKPQRDSWNEPYKMTAETKFYTSLTNFRVRKGGMEWTENQKKACLLFKHCRHTVPENEVRRRCEEAGINLNANEIKRIYEKLKFAVAVFRKQDSK